MKNGEMEKRVAVLEAEVALLNSKAEKKDQTTEKPWWEDHIGVFADDPIYVEAMRLGREYRESQQMVYDDEDE